ncbi:hypothetical protein D3C87_1844820 [compost metagenome]
MNDGIQHKVAKVIHRKAGILVVPLSAPFGRIRWWIICRGYRPELVMSLPKATLDKRLVIRTLARKVGNSAVDSFNDAVARLTDHVAPISKEG